jgi:DNA-directed RNA polymerase subunit RPC12/RpoP
MPKLEMVMWECIRCGKTFDLNSEHYNLYINNVVGEQFMCEQREYEGEHLGNTSSGIKNEYLCESCSRSFVRWLRESKNDHSTG